jgi:hypothetical protein
MGRHIVRGLGAILVAMSFISSATPTSASEPGNNSFTFSSIQLAGDYEVLISTSSAVQAIKTGTMNSNSDVDYVVVTCGNRLESHIQYIRLGDTVSAMAPATMPGDYDIYIYDPSSSTAIASGTNGGTVAESIDLSGTPRNTIIAKVIRYDGALGNYGLRVDCQA